MGVGSSRTGGLFVELLLGALIIFSLIGSELSENSLVLVVTSKLYLSFPLTGIT